MRVGLVVAVLMVTVGQVHAGSSIRCDDLSTVDLEIDGLLDDWPKAPLMKAGSPTNGQVELRCSWDGTAFALSLDIKDDRVIRVRSGKAHEDHVSIRIAASGAPLVVDVFPGNAMAKARIVKPAKVSVRDSLQPKGFSVELRVPAKALAGFSGSTPSLDLGIVFHDADQATGGADTELTLPLSESACEAATTACGAASSAASNIARRRFGMVTPSRFPGGHHTFSCPPQDRST